MTTKMTRKEFLELSAGFAGLGLVIGCGDDGSGEDTVEGSAEHGDQGDHGSESGSESSGGSTTGPAAACSATISDNHAHELTVTQADLDAATDKTYEIMGGSTHSHSVTITAADFATLQGGMSIMVRSTEVSAHMHEVTVMCP